MAVSSVNLVGTSGSIGPDGHVDLTATYEVFTTSGTNDLAWTVLQAVLNAVPDSWVTGNDNLPAAWLQHIGEAALLVEHKQWRVPVKYSTRPLSGPAGTFTPKVNFGATGVTILDQPWKISGTFVNTTKSTTKDKDGDSIRISGIEELKEVEVPDGYDTLHLEGATATISLPNRAQAVRKCNSASLWGLTPRQLYLSQWTYDIRRYGAAEYVWHSLEFWIRYEGWYERFWNASRKMLNPDYVEGTSDPEDRVIAILGADKLPVTEPHLLSGAGVPCKPEDAVERVVQVIEEFNFLTLGFPTTLPGPFV